MPANTQELIYHDPKPHQKKFAKIAEAICDPGYFPDLSKGKKLKTVCKIVKDKKTGKQEYKWIRQLPDCVTCDLLPGKEFNKIISSGINDDLGADTFCSISGTYSHNIIKNVIIQSQECWKL